MSDKTKILLILLAVAGCVAAFYCLQNKSLKKQLDDKQHDIDVLEDSYMKLLKEYISKQQEIPKELQDDLMNLCTQYKGLQPEVVEEMERVLKLLQDGQDELAVESLSKIVENVIEEKCKQENIKGNSFFNNLKIAVDKGLISKRVFHLSNVLRDTRNTIAHEVGVTMKKSEVVMNISAGIEILFALKGIPNE
ncbi:MAG: DUF4145 domain-containing protein [Bacteroidales bacterium]|nr:DUF4145 domain-containing protein [Bacteroidales bacterium]